MCELQENGRLRFRSFGTFNIALLVKHGWRLFKQPESLLENVMKAKYYLTSDFLHSHLKYGSSFTWRSICAARKVLFDGLS